MIHSLLAQLPIGWVESVPNQQFDGMDAAAPPSEVIELASRMYNAARQGHVDVFQQALPAGLPANLTNEKGDTLVSLKSSRSICL